MNKLGANGHKKYDRHNYAHGQGIFMLMTFSPRTSIFFFMKKLVIELKQNLIDIMESRELSMRALSLRANLSQGAVKQIITHDYSPQLDTVIKLANALDLGLEELVYGKKEQPTIEAIAPVPTKLCDKDLLIGAVTCVDEMLREKNITLDSYKRAVAYHLWYELDLIDAAGSKTERIEMILRIVQ